MAALPEILLQFFSPLSIMKIISNTLYTQSSRTTCSCVLAETLLGCSHPRERGRMAIHCFCPRGEFYGEAELYNLWTRDINADQRLKMLLLLQSLSSPPLIPPSLPPSSPTSCHLSRQYDRLQGFPKQFDCKNHLGCVFNMQIPGFLN